jgi:cytochrome c
MKITTLLIASTLAALVSGAANAADGAKLFAEKTCIACHGKDGKTPLLPAYPRIAGQSKDYVLAQMNDIKSGKRANGNSAAMKGVMVIVTDAEIKDLAEFVSKMPR